MASARRLTTWWAAVDVLRVWWRTRNLLLYGGDGTQVGNDDLLDFLAEKLQPFPYVVNEDILGWISTRPLAANQRDQLSGIIQTWAFEGVISLEAFGHWCAIVFRGPPSRQGLRITATIIPDVLRPIVAPSPDSEPSGCCIDDPLTESD